MMDAWRTYTERKRLILTAIALAVLFVVSYALNFKATLSLISLEDSLDRECAALRDRSQVRAGHTQEGSQLYLFDDLSRAQSELLETIEGFTGKVSVHEVERPMIAKQNGRNLASLTVHVDGDYKTLIRLIRYNETHLKGHYLQSVRMTLHEDKISNRKSVRAGLYYQVVVA